jgi:hypothetical protein
MTWILLAGLVLLTALVYWPGLDGGFAFDDYSNLVMNTQLHVSTLRWSDWVAATFSSPSEVLHRPLAMLSFAVNHYFTALDPRPMKLVNLAIHLGNTLLVFGLSRSLMQAALTGSADAARNRIALFVSAWWALMPINLMAVLLVVQRMESLSHSFVFAGLWMYLHGRLLQQRGRPGWKYMISGLLGGAALGLLSKESAVLLPVYALCIELALLGFRRNDGARDPVLVRFFAAIILIPGALGLAWLLPRAFNPATYAHRNFNLAERLLTEPRIVLDYFHWTVAPVLSQLSLFHDDYPVSRSFLDSPATVLGWAAVAALVFAIWHFRRTRPLISLGLAWFASAQLLTATIIPLELVFEHRNYLASLGLCLVLADLLLIGPLAQRSRLLCMVAAGALLLFYGGSTHLRALEWSNPLRFALTEAAKHPQSPRATYQLAQEFAILSQGRANSPFTPAAFAAFERARHVPGAGIAPAQGALLLAARTGHPFLDAWWQDIQSRLRAQPIGPQELGALAALSNCSISGQCRFPPGAMLGMFAAALSHGDNAEVLNVYGNYALNTLHDPLLAERLWVQASRNNPGEVQYPITLAKLYMAQGRDDEARQQIHRVRSLGKLGQYESLATYLESRLATTVSERNMEKSQ